MPALVVTAANAPYLPLLRALVSSLRREGPPDLALGLLDVGLGAEGRRWAADHFAAIVEPGWDLEVPDGVRVGQPWLRAMTARPFLPRHFPGWDPIVWLDADTWLQRPFVLEWLLSECAGGALAAVPQVDRCYTHHPTAVAWRKQRLEAYYGPDAAAEVDHRVYYNSGVFALRADAPLWEVWADAFAFGLRRSGAAWVTDQAALNRAVWTTGLPVRRLPALCNWACHLAPPRWDFAEGLFREPQVPYAPIGLLHLTHDTKDRPLRVRHPDGHAVTLSLRYPHPEL